jgi:hypothetical protein
MNKIAEITMILPNGNRFIRVNGNPLIEIIDADKFFTAEKVSEIVVTALNEYSICKKCKAVTKTKNDLCYGCHVLADPSL